MIPWTYYSAVISGQEINTVSGVVVVRDCRRVILLAELEDQSGGMTTMLFVFASDAMLISQRIH